MMLNKAIVLVFLLTIAALKLCGQKCPVGLDQSRMPSDYEINQLLKLRKNTQFARNSTIEGVITIPIVVHVIHNNASGIIGGPNNSNISDEQIFSQIEVLNEDFRRKTGTPGFNSNPVGADMEIEFVLATEDPLGRPTSGITRHFNSRERWDAFSRREEIANIVSWDANRYLNIWVLNFVNTFIGFAEFPGAPIDGLFLTDPPVLTDGVYVDHNVFGRQIGTATNGPYTRGRTLTHEIGHWLGLIHIWGDEECGNDFCDDTPTQEEENLSVNCGPFFSSCTGRSVRAMIENYMDYSADECMNIFTQDQKSRTRAVLELSDRRRRLVEFNRNIDFSISNFEVNLVNHPNRIDQVGIQVLLPQRQSFFIRVYDVLGRLVDTADFRNYFSTVVPASRLRRLRRDTPYILQVESEGEIKTKRLILF